MEICENTLVHRLKTENACELFTFAGIHGAAKLRQRAMEIIVENIATAKVEHIIIRILRVLLNGIML
jgi:hypothetical protein